MINQTLQQSEIVPISNPSVIPDVNKELLLDEIDRQANIMQRLATKLDIAVAHQKLLYSKLREFDN